MKHILARVLLGAGAVLVLLGALAGLVNRELLDGRAFAAHADAVRQDRDVSRLLSAAITAQVLAADPDLVAVRPLLEASATALVRSPSFTPFVTAAARSAHSAFTRADSPALVLRLADVGAVLLPALRTVAPEASARLPDTLDVTLTRVGGQSFAATPIRVAHLVRVLGVLLPLLALGCLAGWVLLAADRRRAVAAAGVAVAAAGVALAVVGLVGGEIARAQGRDRLGGALVHALWTQLEPAFWWSAAALVGAGLLLAVAARTAFGADRLGLAAARVWAAVRTRPATTAGRSTRAAALVLAGALVLLDPGRAVAVAGVLAGVACVAYGLLQAAELLPAPRVRESAPVPGRGRPAPLALGCAALAALLVLGLVVTAARPPRSFAEPAATDDATACNGSPRLCDRRYDQVAFPATHNSMSAADEPGWFFPEQPTGILGQLRAGIRALLFDTWDAAPTSRAGLVTTASQDRSAAVAEAKEAYGADVLASALRVRNAVGLRPTGPASPYLCHNLCELGATPLEPVMRDVAGWMRAHPREVVTFFIQDDVSPADTAAVLDRAGLLPFVHTQAEGRPWPTLGEMIDSGRRLVVLMEHRSGGSAYPWLLDGFRWAQDTPYDFTSAAQFSCARNRGPADAPLLLVNHWLSNFATRVADAGVVNARDVLLPRLTRCQDERHRVPNFVAVDFYDRGDLFAVVDQLNGLP